MGRKPSNELDLSKGLGVLAERLPVTHSDEDHRKRKFMFRAMDENGSGQLCLAEIDLGVKNYLGEEIFLMKNAIKEAFKASKATDPLGGVDTDYVEHHEFRLLMVCLRRYIELFCAFQHIDTDSDHRIDFNEFAAALPAIAEWGVEIENPVAAFHEIDTNQG